MIKTTLGSKIEGSKVNNLNAIRLVLALAVVLSHSSPITLGTRAGWDPLAWLIKGESCGWTSVNIFFLISGMLITASWLRSRSMSEYLLKRIFRIYPAFILALGFSGLAIWLFCPEFRASVGHGGSWLVMLILDAFSLTSGSVSKTYWKGVFLHNPSPGYANESLWTIPKEFSCYLLVSVMGLFCLFKKRHLILGFSGAVLLYYALCFFKLRWGVSPTPRLLTYFLAGMCAWLWRDKIPFSGRIALGCLFGLFCASRYSSSLSAALFPLLGGYAVLWLGYCPALNLVGWTNKTDLSYGIYLYAFPVQQIVAVPECLRNPWTNFLISAPAALLLAWFSWHLVEKRFLALKKRGFAQDDYDPGAGTEREVSARR